MRLNTNQILEICQKYKSRKFLKKQLCVEYRISFVTLNKYLKNNNIQTNNKYFVDSNYFNTIDTENKAYFLGLLYADGSNIEKRNSIGISLQERDKYILDIFKKSIKLEKPLDFINRKIEKETFQNQWKLSIINKDISKSLSKLGCCANKSLTLKFPTKEQVPEYLIPHFLRGVWDGDGHIGLYRRKKNNSIFVDVSLTSTIMFCNALSLILKQKDINTSITIKNQNKITRQIHINSRPQAIKFLDWIYKDATIFLNRKFDKYKEIKLSYETYINSRK